jgi:hypothetical protein
VIQTDFGNSKRQFSAWFSPFCATESISKIPRMSSIPNPEQINPTINRQWGKIILSPGSPLETFTQQTAGWTVVIMDRKLGM